MTFLITSCKNEKGINATIQEFVLQNVESYDYCGYGYIAFDILVTKEKGTMGKVLLNSPTEWCSIEANKSCGTIINDKDSNDIIVFPMKGDIANTKNIYLSDSNTDTIRVMVKKQFYEYSLDSMNKWLIKNINKKSKINLFNQANRKNINVNLSSSVAFKFLIRGKNIDIETSDTLFKMVTKYPRPSVLHPSN